jgi:hypothetical protein
MFHLRKTDWPWVALQGRSVFHNAQELEEFAGAITEISGRDGDFLAAAQTEEIDGRIAKYG